MTSGLLNAPAAPAVPAVSGELDGRLAQSTPPDSAGVPLIVVAGAARSGKSSVVHALLGSPPAALLGGSAPPPAVDPGPRSSGPGLEQAPDGTGGRVTAVALAGPAPVAPYLVFRYGERPTGQAFIPGHPKPRRVGLDELRLGDFAPVASGGPTRPPRRVEITYPADLLRWLSLVDTPDMGEVDQPGRDILIDTAQRGAGLLYVTSAGARLGTAELDLLTEAARRGIPVVFAITTIDRYPEWPAVVAANRSALQDRAPALADAPWIALDARPDEVGARPELDARPDEVGARPEVATGIPALRQALLDLAAAARTRAGSAGAERVVPAVTIAAHASDERWRQILEDETRARQVSLQQRLAIDLATIHVRGVQEIGSGRGCAWLPHALDRELHALSVRLTRGLDLAAGDIARRVFAAVLDVEPDPAVLRRIMGATRRAMVCGDGRPVEDRILLLTATSGAAVLTGTAALTNLSSLPAGGPAEPPILREVGVGLTAGCFLFWQRRTSADKRDCRRWLQQAVHVVEVELQRELNQRFADLREALAAVAADTVDHGVLLA